MESNYVSFFLSILIVFLVCVSYEVSASTKSNEPFKPIGNLQDPEVVKIAQFAVAEHNKQANTKLKFVSVVRGRSGTVAGIRYILVISATDESIPVGPNKYYEASVQDIPWEKIKILHSFGLIGAPAPKSNEHFTHKLNAIEPIGNLQDPVVVGIAKFAVTEHNKQANTKLKLVSVVDGTHQRVAGTNYRLVISTTDDSIPTGPNQYYNTWVYVREWQNYTELEYFNLIGEKPRLAPAPAPLRF